MARVPRRPTPFLILCYATACLDRVNVGFAALEMEPRLGLTPAIHACLIAAGRARSAAVAKA